jgi:hypothetical protein
MYGRATGDRAPRREAGGWGPDDPFPADSDEAGAGSAGNESPLDPEPRRSWSEGPAHPAAGVAPVRLTDTPFMKSSR